MVAELKPRLEQRGIVVDDFNYSSIQLNSFNSIVIQDIELEFHLNKKMYGKESFSARFNSASIVIRFADFNNPSFFFTFNNFSLFIEPDENLDKKPFGKLENGCVKSRIPLYLKHPEESANEILTEIKTLFNENKTPLDLDIQVDVLLVIDEKEVKVSLYTEHKDGITYIKFNDKDILEASKRFDLDLAEKEAEIISNYPSKVPTMIKITRDAKRLSEFEKGKDQSFPEDAYRHIYWSYHLARELGADLAKEITDAHETVPGNTPQERKMDYHNNDVGRKYACTNMSEEEIKNIVENSNEVIRSPNELQ